MFSNFLLSMLISTADAKPSKKQLQAVETFRSANGIKVTPQTSESTKMIRMKVMNAVGVDVVTAKGDAVQAAVKEVARSLAVDGKDRQSIQRFIDEKGTTISTYGSPSTLLKQVYGDRDILIINIYVEVDKEQLTNDLIDGGYIAGKKAYSSLLVSQS